MWTKPQNLLAGVLLHEPQPQAIMMTDASLRGWGAHVEDQVASGIWSHCQQGEHINVLELMAIRQGLLSFLSLLSNKIVQVPDPRDFPALRNPSCDIATATHPRMSQRSSRCSVSAGSSPVDRVDQGCSNRSSAFGDARL